VIVCYSLARSANLPEGLGLYILLALISSSVSRGGVYQGQGEGYAPMNQDESKMLLWSQILRPNLVLEATVKGGKPN